MKLVENAFRPWLNGSEQSNIFVGDPNGRPYIVRARSRSWIPINLLIFASSEEDAVERVKDGLRKSLNVAKARNDNVSYTTRDVARYELFIELMDVPTNVEVEPYDPRYVIKAGWGRGLE